MTKSKSSPAKAPKVAIVMGSHSDWETMQHAATILKDFDVSYISEIVSAHRTPKKLYDFARSASTKGLQIIIAGAGGAAHLPGMLAAMTPLPVLGVPVASKSLSGLDSLLSIAQMPKGIPVATLAIGVAGASNAALAAISILALQDKSLAKAYKIFREQQTKSVLKMKLPKIKRSRLGL